jgi:hypothetical protein
MRAIRMPPLTFDGSAGALVHPFTEDGSTEMDYTRNRGVYTDVPLGIILEAFASAYPGFGADRTTIDDPAFSSGRPSRRQP